MLFAIAVAGYRQIETRQLKSQGHDSDFDLMAKRAFHGSAPFLETASSSLLAGQPNLRMPVRY
jgi:hypothetical protein